MLSGFLPEIVYFTKKTCTPQWELRPERISFHDLTFVLEGSAAYSIDGQSYALRAGQAVYIPRGSYRAAQCENMLCAAFNFRSDIELGAATVTTWGNDPTALAYINEFNAAWLQDPKANAMQCNALLMLLIHRLLTKEGSAKNYLVERMKGYILRHYAQSIRVNDIAVHMNMSPAYCGTLFKRHTGQTILEYINSIRVNHASDLLRSGEFNVSQAARQAGFTDVYYFSKVFKREKGFPPSALLRGGAL